MFCKQIPKKKEKWTQNAMIFLSYMLGQAIIKVISLPHNPSFLSSEFKVTELMMNQHLTLKDSVNCPTGKKTVLYSQV